MRYSYLILILLLSAACRDNTSVHRETSKAPKKIAPITYSDDETDVEELELSNSYNNMLLTNARNIGEFFDHRLRFFKIDAPKLSIGSASVDEVVLYFIDSTLARIRYTVNHDVSNYLMDSLGVSRFKPLDERSKELLASKKVWNKYKRQLHDELENYELVWRKEDAVTRFRVHKNTLDSADSFHYYHEMPGYKAKIREIETLYNIMDKAAAIPELN